MCVLLFMVINMDEKYIKIALEEAKKSLKSSDVPVGAVIVKNNKILSKGHNIKEKKQISTKHAEIIAIEKACRKEKNWYLSDCTIYITMEPCLMCAGAIIQSRINRVVYAIENKKFGSCCSINNVFEKQKNIEILKIKNKNLSDESSKMLMSFFKNRRK